MPDSLPTLIPVRYGDLDPQGHVNNARIATFIEQARTEYLIGVGLWDGRDFLDLGVIVADVHIVYLAPIYLGQTVRVETHVTRLGNKSMTFTYQLEDAETRQPLARAETVMVTYDYHTRASIPIPDAWRKKVSAFEKIEDF